jgi:hypothetical protein
MSPLFTMKLINENTYWHGTGKTFNCHLSFCPAKTIIQAIFFCKVNIFPLLEKFPPRTPTLFS